MTAIEICPADGLLQGSAVKFQFRCEGIPFEGFVVRVGDQIFAYENRCRHLPLPLDHEANRFFTTDGAHLVCSSHGAIYEPSTGLCVRGPCEGARLKKLEASLQNGNVVVLVPGGSAI
ncbi:MAG TPA: Rieske (2Fe-2S) protein [Verrucomicrobiales bacterium]|nr:Rieske (2Fe-2S) protein [Verrucomicrobiales bacterium]